MLLCVSGIVTSGPPTQSFVHVDLTAQVVREMAVRKVLEDFSGEASVAGYTVLYGRGQVSKAVLLVDTPTGCAP